MAATSVVDDRAFERMYRRYVRDVYRFALALVRNPSDAEDVTQTTFMNAYRALQSGEEPRRPQNWLMTIAHNTARSRVRRAVRRPREVPLDDVVGQLAVPEQERTNIRELLRALGRLPFNQRAASPCASSKDAATRRSPRRSASPCLPSRLSSPARAGRYG